MPHRLPDVRRMLKGFDAVSLREQSGVSFCKEVLGRQDCTLALDPTMLVARDFYSEMMVPRGPNGSYVLNYVLDENPLVEEVLSKVVKGPAEGHKVVKLTLDDGEQTLEVPNWVHAFREAKYVVTDSFHGTVFSILFRKPFICIGNKSRGIDRFASLLSLLGLDDRLVTETKETGAVSAPIDYDSVYSRLNTLRLESRAFLEMALAPKMADVDV